MTTDRPPAGPTGPAGGTLNPPTAPPARRPAMRTFGTRLRFTAHGGGHWVAADAGERFEIERRRPEPGCPGG